MNYCIELNSGMFQLCSCFMQKLSENLIQVPAVTGFIPYVNQGICSDTIVSQRQLRTYVP